MMFASIGDAPDPLLEVPVLPRPAAGRGDVDEVPLQSRGVRQSMGRAGEEAARFMGPSTRLLHRDYDHDGDNDGARPGSSEQLYADGDADGAGTERRRVGADAGAWTAVDESGTHVVRPADTLQGLALQYGVTVDDIRRANSLWPGDSIYLKRTLVIPRARVPAAALSAAQQQQQQQPTQAPRRSFEPAEPAWAGMRRSASEPDARKRSPGADVQSLLRKVDADLTSVKASMPDGGAPSAASSAAAAARGRPAPPHAAQGSIRGALSALLPW